MNEKKSFFESEHSSDVKQNSLEMGVVFADEQELKHFKTFFPGGNIYNPSDENLDDLAKFMTSRNMLADSGIPAGYTYLSQFITHDISLDSENRVDPWEPITPSTNLRSPFFDLEPIYGSDNPVKGELCRAALLNGKSRLKLDYTSGESPVEKQFPNDLPREKYSSKPMIVDERNDENLAVAQTQVAFMKFHNAIVELLGGDDTEATFDEARRIAIRHYQWIVLDDFLPRIVKKSILEEVLNNKNRFYFPDSENPEMPTEFSFAALRIGHSMIRDTYQWNRIKNDGVGNDPASLDKLAIFTHGGQGFKENLPSTWLINWNWFYDIDDSKNTEKEKFNFARRIDTYFTEILGHFRGKPTDGFKRENSLPALDLYRSRALGVPSGQTVARKIQEKVGAVEILNTGELDEILPNDLREAFDKETPLMFYILAEAELEAKRYGTDTLGDVGSYILAETFITLLKLSPYSILRDEWVKDKIFGQNKNFGMADMLKFNASMNKEFNELNPTETA